MRVLLYLGILLFVSPYLPLFEKLQAAEFSGKTMSGKQEYSGFIVNNGQLIDQKGRPNPQVLYLLNDHGFNVQLRKSGFSYDLYFIKPVPNPYFLKLPENNSLHSTRHSDSLIPEYHFMRIDIDLVNANPSPIIETSGPLSGYLNYYTSGTPDEGITTVMSYTTILCKNIYPGIDLQFLGSEEAGFEYNFIIHPGGRVSSIRLKAEGPDHINMNGDGIRCKTSMGDLDETVPHCYYRLNDKNVRVNGRFKKLSGHVYGFALDQPVPETALIIIDPVPVRRWGTYYGGTGWESSLSRCCVTDSSGNIFISGTTHSANNIATAGAHQSVYSGNGDAFLVKFLSTGQRLWGTYYGGNASTDGAGCAADPEGNSYLVGRTHATNNIATAGAYQTIKRGGIDAFVAKFTPSGVRLWGTYYGGNETGNPAADEFEDCSADNVGNIYCSGLTTAPDYVATPGAHQTILGGTCDATLIKFSVDGQCLWGTYYGGANQEGSSGSSISESGFIYLSGTTGSPDNIATPGSFMPVYTGGSKVFLACFDLAGTRLWGTYFGGEADDYYSGCVSDSSGNVYLFGGTGSNTNIATPGAFLMNRANGSSYLEKFDITGARIWGTYYPGELRGAAIDDSGFVFLAGYNFLPNPLVSTPDAYQSFPRSIGEAFLGKMNGNGQRIWGTYYGGTTTDQGACCAVDRNDNLYLYGNTYSTNNTVNNTSPCSRNRNANYIATPGAHQPELSVAADAFLVKFTDCYSPDTALQVFGPSALCLNSTGIVFSIAPITYAADYHWCVTGDLTITSGQGTTAISVDVGSSLGVDTISIYGINACDTGFPRVIVRTVFPRPVPFLSGPDSICSGVHAVYLTSGGQSSYVWTISPGYTLVSGGGSGDSSCTVTWNNSGFRWIRVNYSDTHGCDALVPAQFSTWVTDSPAVNIGVMASANPVCAGTSVTFTATPTNGGTIPIFQWLVNGMGGLPSAPTMSYTPVNGDCITCILTSNLVCASGNPATSNSICMTVNPNLLVSITISTPITIICTGTQVTFTASPANQGTLPQYQWKVNGVGVGTSNLTYSYIPLNGDQVSCVLTSNTTCPTGNPATSSTITMTVNANMPVSVLISASNNPVCSGIPVTYTATPTNGGTTPVYLWKVNGIDAGTNSNTYQYIPVNGDLITCTLTSNLICTNGNPATSNTITMGVATSPVVTFTRCNDSITTINAQPFRLKGGIPLGGTYSGPGVTNGIFYPAIAGVGTKTITYSYANAAFCSGSASRSLVISQSSLVVCGNLLTDIRDYKVYPTVQIGSQCWLASNLNYGTMIPGNISQRNNCINEKYCLNDLTGNCELGTANYQWDELMAYDESLSTQGLCPPGWHVPSEADWNTLFATYISNAFAALPLLFTGYSGFNATLSGTRHMNVTWDWNGFSTMFWSSTSHGTTKAWSHGMNDTDPSVSLYPAFRSNAFSVRCLKDN